MSVASLSGVSKSLGQGAYDLMLAEHLLGIDHRTLARWSQKDGHGNPPLLEPTHGWAYSFHDLLSLAVIAGLRQRHISKITIRRTIAYLAERHETERPFARKGVVDTLRLAGSDVLSLPDGENVGAGGQLVMLATVKQYLKPIEYDGNLWARRWRPAPKVALDPQIQAGAPVVLGTRVPTATVLGRLDAGESARLVAEDLLLSVPQVRAAAKFERALQSGEGLALVA